MIFQYSPLITTIQDKVERNGSSEQVATNRAPLVVGKAIPASGLNVNLAVVTFIQQSQTMNCPCCGYLGPLVLERAKRLKTVVRKLWRCQSCRATIEVTVRI